MTELNQQINRRTFVLNDPGRRSRGSILPPDTNFDLIPSARKPTPNQIISSNTEQKKKQHRCKKNQIPLLEEIEIVEAVDVHGHLLDRLEHGRSDLSPAAGRDQPLRRGGGALQTGEPPAQHEHPRRRLRGLRITYSSNPKEKPPPPPPQQQDQATKNMPKPEHNPNPIQPKCRSSQSENWNRNRGGRELGVRARGRGFEEERGGGGGGGGGGGDLFVGGDRCYRSYLDFVEPAYRR